MQTLPSPYVVEFTRFIQAVQYALNAGHKLDTIQAALSSPFRKTSVPRLFQISWHSEKTSSTSNVLAIATDQPGTIFIDLGTFNPIDDPKKTAYPRYIGLSPEVLLSPVFNGLPLSVSINGSSITLTFSLLTGSLHVLDPAQHYALISKLVPSLPPSSTLLQQDPSYKTALHVNADEDRGGDRKLALYIDFLVYPSEEAPQSYSDSILIHSFGSTPLLSGASYPTLFFKDHSGEPGIYQDLLFTQALQEIFQNNSSLTVLYPAHPDDNSDFVPYADWSLGALLRHRESLLLNLNTATSPALAELSRIAHTKIPSGVYADFRDTLYQECVSHLQQSALDQLSC